MISVPENQLASVSVLLEQAINSIKVDTCVTADSMAHFKSADAALWALQTNQLNTLKPRFEDFAANLSAQIHKAVALNWSGFNFDVPRAVFELMSDSLVHLIRNSLDHGIETPEKRLALGKSHVGLIYLSVEICRGLFAFKISDDGAGPDLALIAARALSKGLRTQEQLQGLVNTEILHLIFESEFSTRHETSDVSGRGVGLDAVRAGFEQIQGSVSAEINSQNKLTIQLQCPLNCAGVTVIPIQLGNVVVWLQSDLVVIVNDISSLNQEALQNGNQIIKRLTLTQSAENSAFQGIQIKLPDGSFIAFEGQFPEAQFQKFRPLDPIWKSTGPKWIQEWMAAVPGVPLASRSLGILADATSLMDILQN